MEEVESVEVIIIVVELEEHAKNHGTEAPHAKHYAFRVDKQRVVASTPTITGTKILAEVVLARAIARMGLGQEVVPLQQPSIAHTKNHPKVKPPFPVCIPSSR